MCGIAGFIDFNKRADLNVLQRMTNVLEHRGPNDAGYEVFEDQAALVGFGQRRLSIQDLSSSGHQPMHFNHLSILFNGEVYNFKEIRKKLEQLGYAFHSGTDTEVLIKGYDAWGMKVLDQCIGMFAFAIYDRRERKVILCRDRAGVKPLYYYRDSNTLLFGSELKSLCEFPGFRRDIDVSSMSLFLQFSYIPGPYTIYKDTHKLRPGYYITLDLANNSLQETCYWNVLDLYRQPLTTMPEHEIINQTDLLLQSAYKYRMVADVPVGVFLSGGYDSASVAAILQSGAGSRIKTFSIGYKEQQWDESAEARKIARHLGTDHNEWIVGPEDAKGVLDLLPEIYDEPFADNSTVPTTLVSKLASQQVKVALSGDGGDEIFAGYNKFNQSLSYTSRFPRGVQSMLSHAMGLVNPAYIPYFNKQYNFTSRYEKMKLIWASGQSPRALKYIAQYLTESEVQHYMGQTAAAYKTNFDLNGELNGVNDELNRLLAVDYKTFLVDNNLVKVDRATMSVGIEGREPMLDHRIVEFMAKVPASLKTKNGINKYILKQVVHRYIPPALMDRPKRPFIAPLQVWFREELKEKMQYYLSADRLEKTGLLHGQNINKLLQRYLAGEKVSHQKLWNILVFQLWYNRWIEKL
ncbi:asparagine synthase (glutamine-hydrolysing) [Chitinophaga terrae (ex Kim and Jung 2007)]|uniref:asparagine synthase (glutamine-hydrolyzing) n=1 Tax=Chitinophaga terrae (ex Kim and Jung 2007) TaxID=408074 RepID=A0A1H4CCX0_9BACT|nr:asparagine synthase (glutamine-hydrolyzing) [Chitinophaga terrae (ex Kim and Jung 2007)]MDQ0109378.1 asparagine synthase (glutamine-hydrolyzing) [Chitinophaga terrae (ex Kim and Jung 2007)]GEP88883.1 asparagine synthetase B [Chitinophaga terrae (ex Kim and Jung 2007)]SEA57942.1 asparagine synthase (glutamine-hydrolysing) [Chitinophaga terrae (ex Kim and Jung 2007)]